MFLYTLYIPSSSIVFEVYLNTVELWGCSYIKYFLNLLALITKSKKNYNYNRLLLHRVSVAADYEFHRI
jgi:hypothetical protein